jgi:eukaryotic-like serine/threonine-protein kinase
MAVVTGQSFGNFQVVRLLGEGGFGEVYEAENPFLQRRAAVKVLHAGMGQDPELVRRFLNEARAASAIRHPNIIDVFDAGVTPDGEPYILMEFLEGDSLQKVLQQQGKLDLATAQEIAQQAGSALSAAHAAGIVHRDLKPENLFLIPDPATALGFRVKVLDFGIAKVKHPGDHGGSAVRTQAGLLMGSPTYMSPEQCRDSSEVDHRSDIYSLGIIVYEMLVGTPPFSTKSATEMLVMQLSANPPPLREHVPSLPEHVEKAVARALSKDRELRYGSVDYFVGALLGTYPVATTQGSSVSAMDTADTAERPMTRTGVGYPHTPSPVAVVALSSRFGLTPVPVPVTGPTITTLSRATGEASGSGGESRVDFAAVRPKRWPFVLAMAAIAAAVVLVALRFHGDLFSTPIAAPAAASAPAPSPAPPATVRVIVRSDPAGATVVDPTQGTVLGITPLEKVYPQGGGSLGLLLRLDGYREKTVSVSLDGNSSTSVDLDPVPAARPEAPAKPDTARPVAEKPALPRARRPTKPIIDKEEEWRVH